jgi:DNA-binding LytR/AlgR family response regulator
MIHFVSDSGTEVFDCLTVDLLFIKAADNYVEIHYLDLGIPRKKLLRQTLKNILQLLPFKEFVRCHKSYIVNLNQIASSYGNAQGYKLRIKNTSEVVQVSRSNSQVVKQYLLSNSNL